MPTQFNTQIKNLYNQYIQSPQVNKLSDNQFEHVQNVLLPFLMGIAAQEEKFKPLEWTPDLVADFVLTTMPRLIDGMWDAESVVPILRNFISFLGKTIKLKQVGKFYQALNAIRKQFIQKSEDMALGDLEDDDYFDDVDDEIVFAPTREEIEQAIDVEQQTFNWTAKQRRAFTTRFDATLDRLEDEVDALKTKNSQVSQAELDNFERQTDKLLEKFSHSSAWQLVDQGFQPDAIAFLKNFAQQQYVVFGVTPTNWSMATIVMAVDSSPFLDQVAENNDLGAAVMMILMPFVRFLQMGKINLNATIVAVTLQLCIIDIRQQITDTIDFSADFAKFPALKQVFDESGLDSSDSHVVQAFFIGYQHGVDQTFGPDILTELEQHTNQVSEPAKQQDNVIDFKSAQKRHYDK